MGELGTRRYQAVFEQALRDTVNYHVSLISSAVSPYQCWTTMPSYTLRWVEDQQVRRLPLRDHLGHRPGHRHRGFGGTRAGAVDQFRYRPDL